MEKRRLGRSPLELSTIVLGSNVFGWTIDEAQSFAVLDAYVAGGGNCIDTADVYSTWVPGNHGGESETIIGRWIKRRGNRDQVIVATKVGSAMGPTLQGLSPSYIERAVEASLKRLDTDYIDLYQAHHDDESTPLEETLAAFGRLIQQGKVRAIGASNYTADRLARALEVSRTQSLPRYESLQPPYNLYDRSPYEESLAPLCVQQQIGVIPYYGLASGFLTGKYRSESDLSQSARGQGVGKKYLNARGLRILDALDDVARTYHSTPASVALAWLMTRPAVTAPIASATRPEQVHDLLAAAEVHLDQAALEELDTASDAGVAREKVGQ
jgi:aryl-alcohol dehydrogenase-like predicted oxidoreductase